MKRGLFILFSILSINGFGQVTGEIANDGRKISDNISYRIESNQTGVLIFDIAVNVEGEITSCEWNKIESTLNSHRLSYMAKNRILNQLKFEAGNGYPTFHHGKVTITVEP